VTRPALGWLERGAAALRRLGLGALVDRAGPSVGGLVARRPVTVNRLRLAGRHVGQLYYLRELQRGRDRFLAELLRAAAPPGGIAVDVGAHIGYLTLELAREVGPDGTVYALEPDPAAAATLRANLRRNGLGARVVVAECAAGAARGRGVLHLAGGGEANTLAELPGSRGWVEVSVAAVDDVVGDKPVDVVKLDVEGSEVEALKGMERLLGRRADLALVVECHPGRLASMGTSAEELLELLRRRGFSVRQVDEAAARLCDIDLGGAEYVNLICVRGAAGGRLPG
jgi:FkbM family methyltransferase